MWTPVWLTPPMVAASVAAFFSRVAAQTLLPVVSAAIRVRRRTWFLPAHPRHTPYARRFRAGVYNIVMGPPIFAPLLLCSVGFLGLFASGLRRER